MTIWNKSSPPIGARELLRSMEGDKLRAYLDSGGKPTIGTGSTFMPQGGPVHMGQVITQAQDDALLDKQIMAWVSVIARAIQANLTHDAGSVLVSFIHQMGVNALPGSVLADMINAGLLNRAAAQLNGWVIATANGVRGPVLGIMHRMETQRRMFLGAPLEPTKTEVWAMPDAALRRLYAAACCDAAAYRHGTATWEVHMAVAPVHPIAAQLHAGSGVAAGQLTADELMNLMNPTVET